MVIYTSSVINYNATYNKLLKHVIIKLVMVHHKLLFNRVIRSVLACKLHIKSFIKVIVVNRKT